MHVIADNYATHKRANVRAWLQPAQAVHMHFTPTSSCWMKQVERFFADPPEDCARDGSLASVKQLKDSIVAYMQGRNRAPKQYFGRSAERRFSPKSNGRGRSRNRAGTNHQRLEYRTLATGEFTVPLECGIGHLWREAAFVHSASDKSRQRMIDAGTLQRCAETLSRVRSGIHSNREPPGLSGRRTGEN